MVYKTYFLNIIWQFEHIGTTWPVRGLNLELPSYQYRKATTRGYEAPFLNSH